MSAIKRARAVKVSSIAMAVAILLTVSSDARAQASGVNEDWRHGTTLAGFVGAAAPFSGVDPALGLSLGWEMTPWLGLEGRGTWFPAPDGVSAFAAAFGARMAFMSARPVLPYASAGVGFYRATFDTPARGGMPRFYQQRMGEAALLGRTFDDLLVTIGAGTEVFLSRHVALRPELTVMLVTARSDARAVPVFGVQMAYHFESHPITP
jgi:outer membrane protein with beta-barrel domain